jgi:hypothetical protein
MNLRFFLIAKIRKLAASWWTKPILKAMFKANQSR